MILQYFEGFFLLYAWRFSFLGINSIIKLFAVIQPLNKDTASYPLNRTQGIALC
jgi:hypothetical protein